MLLAPLERPGLVIAGPRSILVLINPIKVVEREARPSPGPAAMAATCHARPHAAG